MDGHPQPSGVMHDVDVAGEKRVVDLGASFMPKGDDAGGESRVPGGERGDTELAKPGIDTGSQRIGMGGDSSNADGFEVPEGCIEHVEGHEIGHADGETGGAGFDDGAFEPVGLEGIRQVQPAAGGGGHPFGRGVGHADDAAAMDPQGPFVRARNHDVRTRAIERKATKGLGDVHGQDGSGCEGPNPLEERFPIDPMSVVKADEGDLDQPGRGLEEKFKVARVEGAVAGLPQFQTRLGRGAEPWGGTGRKVQIGDDDVIGGAELEGTGEKVVGFGTAGAKPDFGRFEAQPPCRDVAAFLDLREVGGATGHAAEFVPPISLIGSEGGNGRDTLGGRIEVGLPGQGRKVALAFVRGQHDVPDQTGMAGGVNRKRWGRTEVLLRHPGGALLLGRSGPLKCHGEERVRELPGDGVGESGYRGRILSM